MCGYSGAGSDMKFYNMDYEPELFDKCRWKS